MAAAAVVAASLSWMAAASALAAAPNILSHVPTAAYCCHGYANDTVDPAQAAPYLTWASSPDPAGAAADRAVGIANVYRYVDTFRVYSGDHAYRSVAGGQYASAVARDCAGAQVETQRPGFLISPYAAQALGLLADELTYRYDPNYTAYFIDDVDAYKYGLKNGPPCNANQPWREPETTEENASLLRRVRIDVHGTQIAPILIVNGLADYASDPALHAAPLGLLDVPNVIGGMCEGCFADNTPDKLASGAEWQDDADLEIRTIRMHKIFWDYVRYIDDNAAARIYTFASFMLAWDPSYSVYQTAYAPLSRGQLHVTPETGIVAYQPLKPIASVEQLRDAGGTYFREYRACYYRAKPLGGCAFVVNSDSSAHAIPALSQRYAHAVSIRNNAMVLEGGSVSFDDAFSNHSLSPLSAIIVTH